MDESIEGRRPRDKPSSKMLSDALVGIVEHLQVGFVAEENVVLSKVERKSLNGALT